MNAELVSTVVSVGSERNEFGFSRTVCACSDCSRNCRFIPGYLIPADLERIIPPEADVFHWAKSHLLASPGALVASSIGTFRVPTLAPARNTEGACIFFKGGLCEIHPVAPYGCAFFDNHMSPEDGDQKSLRGLQAIAEGFRGLYGLLWTALHNDGFRAPFPEESRRRLMEEERRLQSVRPVLRE